jgi:predicted nucleic acid-binding protein
VLACALAAGAALIVSGDQDLLDLGTFRDIRILGAREALDTILSSSR